MERIVNFSNGLGRTFSLIRHFGTIRWIIADMTDSSQLLSALRADKPLNASMQRKLILSLSWPAILAQVSVTIIQMIDASMVGHLGVQAGASIGLVSSSTWLINGICSGSVYGFSVQTAQAIGARNNEEARNCSRQGLLVILGVAFLIGSIGFGLSGMVPVWLGGEDAILADASAYLGIFCLCLPFSLLNTWAIATLQAAGDTRLPGMTQIVMCMLDVLFNYLFIFAMNLGVAGSALGTGAAMACASLFLTWRVLFKNEFLKGKCRIHFTRHSLSKAVRIGVPISLEQLISGSSYVMFTRIVSSLGSVSIAANSFAITAESLCYMPGYGCGSAATAIIGQCTGANRHDLAREISWRIVRIGMGMMALSGVVMFVFAPWLMNILTPDPAVIELGTSMLRLEAFAEPLYGASIVCSGILRGKGDTIWPACLNFLSIWCIRIPLAAWLSRSFGLAGAWVAMGVELDARGLLFLWRLHHSFAPSKKKA